MQIYIITQPLDDPNQLYLDLTDAISITIAGRLATPRGSLSLRALFASPVDFKFTPFNLIGRFAIFDDGVFTGPVIRFTNISNDGASEYIDYEVDFLRSYYYEFVSNTHAADSLATPFNSCNTIKTSLPADWLKWKYVDLPLSGEKTTTITTGNIVKSPAEEFGGLLGGKDGVYLVVIKAPYYDTSVTPAVFEYYNDVGYCLVRPSCLTDMIWYWLSGDEVDPNNARYRLPSLIVSAIEGIYYLPGVTLDYNNDTVNIDDVTITPGSYFIRHIKADGSDEALDIVTGSPTAYTGGGIYRLTIKSGHEAITAKFETSLTVTVADFRDLYYKKHNLYIPYVGSVDVPVMALTSYPAVSEQIKLDIDYVYNLDDGTISAQWHALPGNLIASWAPLPKIPFILNSEGVSFYQIGAQKDLGITGALLSGATSVIGNVASGNILGLIGSAANTAFQLESTFTNAEIAKNVAAATGFTSTSVSGASGRFYRKFGLTTESVDIAGTFNDYMSEHGYPVFLDTVPDYQLNNYRLWLDTQYFNPWAGFWQNFREEIKRELDSMPYIYIKVGV